MLFDWYFDGDVPSQVFDGFQLSEPSARVFDAVAGRVGVTLAGRNTYDDSGWINRGAPHPTAPLLVLSHRAVPGMSDRQTPVTTGIEDAVTTGRDAAGDKDCLPYGRRRHDSGLGGGTRGRGDPASGADPAGRRPTLLPVAPPSTCAFVLSKLSRRQVSSTPTTGSHDDPPHRRRRRLSA